MASKFNKSDTKKKRLLKALEENTGLIATACKEAKVSRGTYYVWIGGDKAFAEAVQDIEEQVYDKVEKKLHNMIDNDNVTAVIFYSKTKMKSRGYVERQEVTGADGEPVKAQIYLPDNGRPNSE